MQAPEQQECFKKDFEKFCTVNCAMFGNCSVHFSPQFLATESTDRTEFGPASSA